MSGNHLFKGALLIVLSEWMFASMGAAVKVLSAELPTEMVVFMRNLVGVFLVLPWVLRFGLHGWRTPVPHLHLLRALAGVGAMYCFFYVLGRMPLADAMLLKLTAPVFIPLVAWLWLGERVARTALLAVPLGMLGVVLVLRPGGEFTLLALVGVAGGLFAALAKTTVRRLGRAGEPAARVVFYFALIAAAVSAPPALTAWVTPGLAAWGWVALIGATGTLGQLLMTRGYAAAPAARVGPFTYVVVLFSALYGYLLWDETLHLGFIAGALLIMAAGLLALRK